MGLPFARRLAAPPRLMLPKAVDLRRLEPRYVFVVAFYHAVALLALWPALFSWTGVVLAVAGVYVFAGFGINLCYHRLLTHRGLVLPRRLEHAFALCGLICMQDSPARWVAVHRLHHQHADRQEDPHSPLAGFFWGHVGWMLVKNHDLSRLGIYERYAKDILRDPFYKRMERPGFHAAVLLGSWLAFLLGGFVTGLLMGWGLAGAVQFGASLLVWGVFVRTVLAWHITWSVNSLAHLWGYRNYETGEDSRNNWFVALLTSGEGWHNNHHADPRAVRHGHRWWELDPIFWVIRGLEAVGLARDVVRPRAQTREPQLERKETQA
jgi:stearoyl-CoA desaturase (delta-9 desaturase)